MSNSSLLLLTVFVPLVGAFVLPPLGQVSRMARNILALLLVATSVVGSGLLLPAVLGGEVVQVNWALAPSIGVNFHLVADSLAVFMAMVSSLVGAIIVAYSWGYIDHYENQDEYYLLVVLFLGAMMGLVFSSNLIFLYLFWEITAVACWRLIGFYREPHMVLRADKAFLVTVFGALVMLIGFIAIYSQYGSFDLLELKAKLGSQPLPGLMVFLILFGILSKSATLPFHSWLPDAGVAPSPVTALLHAAVLVKIGVYVYARLFVATFEIDAFWHVAVPALAAISALVSAGAALVETDIKRIIAYSTVSQLGFIFLGLATHNEMAFAGALLYILMHSLAKGGLFLCAGIVEQNTHVRDIRQMGGLIRTMPITAFSFLLCAFSVMGIPPFGGFFSKLMVMRGASWDQPPWITAAFLVGAVLTILYLIRLFARVFLGEPMEGAFREGSRVMVACVALLALLSLIAGLGIHWPAEIVEKTVGLTQLAAR